MFVQVMLKPCWLPLLPHGKERIVFAVSLPVQTDSINQTVMRTHVVICVPFPPSLFQLVSNTRTHVVSRRIGQVGADGTDTCAKSLS